MEIYIEYLFVDNIIINYLIIFLTSKILSYKLKVKKIIAIDLIATGFAFIFPYIMCYLNMWLIITIKIIFALIIVLLFKKFKRFLDYIACVLTFLTITMVLGGFCFGLLFLLGMKTSINGFIFFGFEFPMGLLVLIISIYSFFIVKLINYLKHKGLNESIKYDVMINVNGKKYNLIGFLDTGNSVYDNNMNKPVLIISFDVYKKIIDNFNVQNTLKQIVLSEFRHPHFINIETISAKDKIFAFEIDGIKIYSNKQIYKNENIIVGVSKTKFSDFDCLIHKDFLKNKVSF